MSPTSQSKFNTRHPINLWYAAFTFVFITYAFGTINSLLVLYLTEKMQFSSDNTYALFAAFNSLVFTLPVISGYLGEKFGYKPMTILGLIACVIGAIIISIPEKLTLSIGLGALAFGIATCTTTCACLVDLSYSKEDPRRESGFTLYYLLFNVGFLVSIASGGYISQYLNYRDAFIFAAIGVLFSLGLFLWLAKRIQPYPGRSMDAQVNLNNTTIFLILSVLSAVVIIVCAYLMEHVELNNFLLWALVIISSICLLYIAAQQKDKLARLKILAFLLLCIIAIGFWALYMLEPSLVTMFIANNVNRHLFSDEIPASTYYALDPFYVITVGLLFTWLWRYLENKGKDLSLPSKFSLSLLSMGSGYWLFALGILLAGTTYFVNMSWVILGYLFLTIAELLISPIGLSMVGRLSPKGKEGLLMGMWQLFIGLSAVISGYLANLAVVPQKGLPTETNHVYKHVFTEIGLMTISVGLVAILLIPLIKRLISDSTEQQTNNKIMETTVVE